MWIAICVGLLIAHLCKTGFKKLARYEQHHNKNTQSTPRNQPANGRRCLRRLPPQRDQSRRLPISINPLFRTIGTHQSNSTRSPGRVRAERVHGRLG